MMSENLPVQQEKSEIFRIMAHQVQLTPQAFVQTVKAMCFPKGEATNEQLAAFLVVANRYGLDPLTKEIYAFPTQGGGVQPIVGIDGWMRLANSNSQFDGLELEEIEDSDGNIQAVRATLWRKDRSKPLILTETLDECRRETPLWKNKPRRMLRHKATIQAIRYAFGYGGLVDPDEAHEIIDVQSEPVEDRPRPQLRDMPVNVNWLKSKLDADGYTYAEARALAGERWGQARLENLTDAQAQELLEALEARKAESLKGDAQ